MKQKTLFEPLTPPEANKRFAEDEAALYDRLKMDEGEFVSRHALMIAIDNGNLGAAMTRLKKKLRETGDRIIHNSDYKGDPSLKRNRKKSAWALNIRRDVGLPEKVM